MHNTKYIKDKRNNTKKRVVDDVVKANHDRSNGYYDAQYTNKNDIPSFNITKEVKYDNIFSATNRIAMCLFDLPSFGNYIINIAPPDTCVELRSSYLMYVATVHQKSNPKHYFQVVEDVMRSRIMDNNSPFSTSSNVVYGVTRADEYFSCISSKRLTPFQYLKKFHPILGAHRFVTTVLVLYDNPLPNTAGMILVLCPKSYALTISESDIYDLDDDVRTYALINRLSSPKISMDRWVNISLMKYTQFFTENEMWFLQCFKPQGPALFSNLALNEFLPLIVNQKYSVTLTSSPFSLIKLDFKQFANVNIKGFSFSFPVEISIIVDSNFTVESNNYVDIHRNFFSIITCLGDKMAKDGLCYALVTRAKLLVVSSNPYSYDMDITKRILNKVLDPCNQNSNSRTAFFTSQKGSGKSQLTKYLNNYGHIVFDSDFYGYCAGVIREISLSEPTFKFSSLTISEQGNLVATWKRDYERYASQGINKSLIEQLASSYILSKGQVLLDSIIFVLEHYIEINSTNDYSSIRKLSQYFAEFNKVYKSEVTALLSNVTYTNACVASVSISDPNFMNNPRFPHAKIIFMTHYDYESFAAMNMTPIYLDTLLRPPITTIDRAGSRDTSLYTDVFLTFYYQYIDSYTFINTSSVYDVRQALGNGNV